MISVTDLRSGTTFEENGDIFEVATYEHIKMGRGSATVKVKVTNLRTGTITEKSFISNASVRDINLDKREAQFLYKDSEFAYFMDNSTFEQVKISLDALVGHKFLKEGEMATVRFYGDEPLALLLPPKISLKVVETAPGVRGNSASNVYKDAILENGIKVRVPLFIKENDSIIVDTRDASYTKRA